MAGVKGKSGGKRPNAGRKPAEKPPLVPVVVAGRDPLELLLQIAFGQTEVSQDQLKAAIAAVPYVHQKKGEGGKKEERQAQAEKVANRFSPARPPLSVVPGGKR
jgi:phage terminase small subunit